MIRLFFCLGRWILRNWWHNAQIATAMLIHIGSIIRDELRRQGHTNEWFADQIGVNVRTINKIFVKQSIDTQRLYQISKILKKDFFQVYSQKL